jgi:hypothetical protein
MGLSEEAPFARPKAQITPDDHHFLHGTVG